jgi:ribosomal protein L29
MKVTMKDLRTKERAEIEKMLNDNRVELRHLKTKAGAQDLKDVRAIRNLRRVVARLATRLQEIKTSNSQ